MKTHLLKGVLYKNNNLYQLQDLLKRGNKKNLRFKAVQKLIKKNSTLIDICDGCGWLKPHLDDSIKYTVSDASNEFKILMKKNKFILNKKYINNNVLIEVFNIR